MKQVLWGVKGLEEGNAKESSREALSGKIEAVLLLLVFEVCGSGEDRQRWSVPWWWRGRRRVCVEGGWEGSTYMFGVVMFEKAKRRVGTQWARLARFSVRSTLLIFNYLSYLKNYICRFTSMKLRETTCKITCSILNLRDLISVGSKYSSSHYFSRLYQMPTV
jgi:hypothetical protein